MRRIEFIASWIGTLHGQRNPVPECQLPAHDVGELYGKFRDSIKKKCPARFQNTATCQNPIATPFQKFVLWNRIVVAIFIVFPHIKRRVGKYGIDNPGLHSPKDIKAIGAIENAMRCGEEWNIHSRILAFFRS
uniref:Uncharacterized protein n=1 Tax=Candidatus Kentrum eta TaxID=2126337 RepID=A0A450UVF4_9GAMM|nr:MAG: hypothetical protein BECKH772A_GA0070896_100915 [Candidatus Kentron sp. H]VFJ96541.1 MAG: hypothetical protein BECKH772B_GA0070898_100935 [Candidatus Kentron sp. H]VFK02457.1 MAG: hypothetical protein BECKH772C_GA0070978_100915 [Candidatus Kentron sp. H]